MDKSINWSDWGDGGSGGSGGGQSFGVSNLVVVLLGSSLNLKGSAFVCTVFLFAASEAESFSDAASPVS